MAYSLDDGTTNYDLGHIQEESQVLNSGVTGISAAIGDTNQTEAVKLLNSQRIINVTGTKIGALAALTTFASAVKTWVVGSDTTTAAKLTYASDLLGSMTVIVRNASTTFVGGSPTRLQYSLSLLEVAP